jgi:hypothetical protein
MEIPGLGAVIKDDEFGWYYSAPVSVPVLGGRPCRILIEGYDDDANKDEFHRAIANFLSIPPSVLIDAQLHVFQYYQDCNAVCGDDECPAIESPHRVWDYVHFGNEAVVLRRDSADKGIYISLECNCDWEKEHGLQIVLKHGLAVNKVGPYDGHCSNADAYADDRLETVVYRPTGPDNV